MPKKQKKKCDVLVIDNASTDGTAELLELKAPTVFYYNTGANLDGAGGFEVYHGDERYDGYKAYI